MPLSTYRSSKCALCAFEVAEWLAPLLAVPPSRRHFSQISTVFTKRVPSPRDGSGTPSKPFARFSTSISQQKGSPKKHTTKKTTTQSSSKGSPTYPGSRRVSWFKRTNPKPSPREPTLPDWKPREKSKYAVFEELVLDQFSYLINKDLNWTKSNARALLKGWGIETREEFQVHVQNFKGRISSSFEKADGGSTDRHNFTYFRLRTAFLAGDVRGLCHEIRHAFLSSTVKLDISQQELKNHRRTADLRYPTEWFPATRAMQRTIHLHVGPTNSGKTYHALQRLEGAKTGVYAGPLRLLAHEVYTRFNAKGKPCALVTGEEQRYPDKLKDIMYSCTVEMVPLNAKLDLAVIDEIQMMGDVDRGWAWTQALMGVQAKEVHLCGELRTVPLIQELAAMMGDKLEIHRYERLSPLKTSRQHLGSLENLQKGDAVIVFSRRGIHAMKNEIEAATKKRCAVVYGSLPPETRAQQANLFNDPNNDYDYLVASDAIGMGLNLAIKRVVFESTSKSNGAGGLKVLEDFEIKQIGGRAGRYKTAQDAVEAAVTDGLDESDGKASLQIPIPKPKSQTTGYVTTIEKFDLDLVTVAMDKEVPPLKAAGILPPSSVIHQFAAYFPPNVPFSWIVLRLHELVHVNPRFQLCRLKDQIAIADIIQTCNLTINDRILFMNSPANTADPGMAHVLMEYAQCVANNSDGHLLDMKNLYFEILDQDMEEYAGGVAEYLRQVETLHKALTLYLWLSYRFAGVFRSQSLAFHAKSLAEAKIDECLNAVHWDSSHRLRQAEKRKKLLESRQVDTAENPTSQNEEDEGEVLDSTEDADLKDEAEVEGLQETGMIEDRQEEGQVEAQELEQTALPGLESDDDSAIDILAHRKLPADEVARVVEHGPLWEKTTQEKSHD